jgi:hypothetical protein
MTYEFLTADNRSCCKSDTIENLCEHCRAAAIEEAACGEVPDPYAEGVKQLRAAAATHETTFEARYKAERLAALLAAEAEDDGTLRVAAIDDDDYVADYEPPDAYAAGIKALQASDAKELR